MNGIRYATAFFITRALLTTCGRNILPAPNRSPTTFMPSISGPSITCNGRSNLCRHSSTSASMKSVMPLTSACLSRSATGAFAPGQFLLGGLLLAAERLGEIDEPLRRVGPAVEQHVLDALEQVFRDLLVDLQLAGVDDAHVEAGLDGVVEKRRVHRLAHHLVARRRGRRTTRC